MQELERRGVPGRILTTDYLSFSDPVALDTIASLSNIELRMYQTERAGNGFHTKGYIFQKSEEYRFIIGSSNLTQDALTRNMEWNTKLVSTDKGEMVNSVLMEFEKLWNATEYTKPYAEFIEEYRRKYEEKGTDFVLYQKYTYEDVCRLLNWETNEVPLNIGGYKYDKKTKTFPVFINYDKSEDISDTTKYEDHFTSSSSLIAISKSGRSVASEDVQNFIHAKERGIQVHLFVRKNKDDKISKEFYYLGHMQASGKVKEFIMPNTDKTAVEIEWMLDVPVREDLYEYIVNE